MSQLDDPKQWRSAVDPKTGRTYWYHRVSRVSTWVKPIFHDDARSSTEYHEEHSLTADDRDNKEEIRENNYVATDYNRAQYSKESSYYSGDDGGESDQEGDSSSTDNGSEDEYNSIEEIGNALSNAVISLTSTDEYTVVDALLFLYPR